MPRASPRQAQGGLGKPILRPYDTIGSTRYVDFDTTRPVFATREDKCHVSHVVADTDSWEQKLAQTLEDMDEVVRYVKNHNLGFTIPYSLGGEGKNYVPDFIACIDDGHGPNDLLNLLIEVTGEKKKDKAAKVTVMFLDQAEFRAQRRQDIKMRDWEIFLNKFLRDTELPVLANAGSVGRDEATEWACGQYDAFAQRRRLEAETAAEVRYIEDLRSSAKALEGERKEPAAAKKKQGKRPKPKGERGPKGRVED